MMDKHLINGGFDRTNPESIYDYSRHLIGHSLLSLMGQDAVLQKRKGKGGLGQMVEELFFQYDLNSNREADFKDAGLELKCTPLIKTAKSESYRIKERLVCTMIDYFEIVKAEFEDSHLIDKCRLMLLLFYLHACKKEIYEYEFVFRVLWQMPDKDLLLIKNDYNTIAEKVRKGEAHLLSEGDTMYLGACRKGQKGDSPQSQPYSEHKAYKRAFSLKPAYMRYVLSHVSGSQDGSYSNFKSVKCSEYELVKTDELAYGTFEQIIAERFMPFIGMNYVEICEELGILPYQAKNKYADISGLIASAGVSKRLSEAEEFVKSGITMKTVRIRENGMPEESMSFKNIDYYEVYENGEWTESEAYELFTTRFLFVAFKLKKGEKIIIRNNKSGEDVIENSYVLDKVFFWTMPASDLEVANEYWTDIRENVLANRISLGSFWNIANDRMFHVRPKANKKSQLTINPNGGMCEKYCYWFNANYVKRIIIENGKNI